MEKFERLEVEIIKFSNADIITTSNVEEGETPIG